MWDKLRGVYFFLTAFAFCLFQPVHMSNTCAHWSKCDTSLTLATACKGLCRLMFSTVSLLSVLVSVSVWSVLICSGLVRPGIFSSGLVLSGLVWHLSVGLQPIRRKQNFVFIILTMQCTSFCVLFIITFNWNCEHAHGLLFWPFRPQSLLLTYEIYNLKKSPATVQTNSSSALDCKQEFLTFARNAFHRRRDNVMGRLTAAHLCAVAFCV